MHTRLRRWGLVMVFVLLVLVVRGDAVDLIITGTGTTGHTIHDEGTPLTNRSGLNFSGAGVSCIDNAGANRTDCAVPGTGSASFSAVTSGTNTTATMVVGSGASLATAPGGTLIATGLSNPLGVSGGGTGQTTAPDDTLLLGNGTLWQFKTFPNCLDTGGQHLNYDASTNTIGCGTTGGAGGGANVALDLGNNATNESTAITKIATTGDTNAIFTEPSTDVLLINVANKWPAAGTADNLATIAAANILSNTSTHKVTNKQMVDDVCTPAPPTITPNADLCEIIDVPALSAALTINAPVGTGGNPVDGQEMVYRFFTTAPRALNWNAIFTANAGIAKPTSTTGNNVITDYVKTIYKAAANEWQIVASTQLPPLITTGYRNLPVTGVKFPTSNPAGLDRSGATDVLLFDTTTAECVSWAFPLPGEYLGSPVLTVRYAMVSATTGGVAINVDVWAKKAGFPIQTPSYGTVNTCTDTAVPTTAGHPDTISCTLTNNDAMVAGDAIDIRLCRNTTHATDTATGDLAIFNVDLNYSK